MDDMTPIIDLLAPVVLLVKAGADNGLGFCQLLDGIHWALSTADLQHSEADGTLQQHI